MTAASRSVTRIVTTMGFARIKFVNAKNFGKEEHAKPGNAKIAVATEANV